MGAKPTEEQQALRETVRRFLVKASPEVEVRRLMSTERGYDDGVWQQLAEMGLVGLAVPEKFDGSGAGWTEVGIVMEECGRVLLCAPYFSTAVLTVSALLACGDEQACADVLPGLAAGRRTATVALAAAPGTPATVRSAFGSGSWRLHGSVDHVLDGGIADLVVVQTHGPEGPSLFLVEGAAEGLERVAVSPLDQTRTQANLALHGVEARLLGAEGGAAAAIGTIRDVGAACLAAEQVGGADEVLRTAVEYARTRYQFGRPIGAFQAVKHMCADMLVELELARSTAAHALVAADSMPDELPLAASLAGVTCSEAFSMVAKQNIQVHGGIGFTWEHSAHLYLKRAKASEFLLGDPTQHVAALADRLQL